MSNVDRHEPGTFSWVELSTTDATAARDFYTSLFGWDVEESPMGDGTFYTMFRLGGRYAAAMYERRSQEIPPHWLPYATVESADRGAARVEELGGTVLAGPFDVFDAGRMAAVQDPTGASLALWEPRSHIGAGVLGEPGTFCWHELATPDAAKAAEFYTALFGWSAEAQQMPEGAYTVFSSGDRQVGGCSSPRERWPGCPPAGPCTSPWRTATPPPPGRRRGAPRCTWPRTTSPAWAACR